MDDTGFYVPKNKISRFAACYERTPTEYLKLQDSGSKKSGYSKMPLHLSGGGGLVSTTEDYYNFCQMLLNGGSPISGSAPSPSTLLPLSDLCIASPPLNS